MGQTLQEHLCDRKLTKLQIMKNARILIESGSINELFLRPEPSIDREFVQPQPEWFALVQECLSLYPFDRPDANKILKYLEQPKPGLLSSLRFSVKKTSALRTSQTLQDSNDSKWPTTQSLDEMLSDTLANLQKDPTVRENFSVDIPLTLLFPQIVA